MEDAIEELRRGRQSTIQLRVLVKEEDDSCNNFQKASELIENIRESFAKAMELLHRTADSSSGNNGGLSLCSDNRSYASSPEKKSRRGSYKRKREEENWTIMSSTFHDGHSWRKYGQKEILNSKFPRSYFRCSRKHTQGCRAIKHVQMMDDNAQMCKTTYIGQHTCTEIQQVPPIISDNDVKRRKTLNPVSGGNEGSSDLDMTIDWKEIFPDEYSQVDLHELDVDMMEILKMNCGFSF